MKKTTFVLIVIAMVIVISFLTVLAQIYLPIEVYLTIIDVMIVGAVILLISNKFKNGFKRN